jgi:flagellar biosynthesis/type III secretory pathway protein FliH
MTTHDLFEPLRTMLLEMTQASRIICRLSTEDYEALSKAVSYFQDACPDSKLVMVRDLQLTKGEIKCETESQIAEYSPGVYFENLHTGLTEVRRQHNYVAV